MEMMEARLQERSGIGYYTYEEDEESFAFSVDGPALVFVVDIRTSAEVPRELKYAMADAYHFDWYAFDIAKSIRGIQEDVRATAQIEVFDATDEETAPNWIWSKYPTLHRPDRDDSIDIDYAVDKSRDTLIYIIKDEILRNYRTALLAVSLDFNEMLSRDEEKGFLREIAVGLDNDVLRMNLVDIDTSYITPQTVFLYDNERMTEYMNHPQILKMIKSNE